MKHLQHDNASVGRAIYELFSRIQGNLQLGVLSLQVLNSALTPATQIIKLLLKLSICQVHRCWWSMEGSHTLPANRDPRHAVVVR